MYFVSWNAPGDRERKEVEPGRPSQKDATAAAYAASGTAGPATGSRLLARVPLLRSVAPSHSLRSAIAMSMGRA